MRENSDSSEVIAIDGGVRKRAGSVLGHLIEGGDESKKTGKFSSIGSDLLACDWAVSCQNSVVRVSGDNPSKGAQGWGTNRAVTGADKGGCCRNGKCGIISVEEGRVE